MISKALAIAMVLTVTALPALACPGKKMLDQNASVEQPQGPVVEQPATTT
ncbi:MAG: hypothetical protein QM682_01805 [Paracoccus sp. (in: a-proteobacteria)]